MKFPIRSLSTQGKCLKENLQVKKKIKKFGLTPCSTAFEGKNTCMGSLHHMQTTTSYQDFDSDNI